MPNRQGILYNRFGNRFALLPYSDQSKIITYATYDNFDSESSTWGEGTAPINRSSNTSWYKDKDAQGFISFGASYNSITNTSALGNKFTIYEVLKHVDFPQQYLEYDYNLVINRGSQSTNEYLFSPLHGITMTGVYDYDCHTTGGVVDIPCHLPTLDQMHITAAAYEYDSTNYSAKVSAFCNYNQSNSNPGSENYSSLSAVQIAGAGSLSKRCYKFIAVVAEDESRIYIGSRSLVEWNMSVLKAYFGVDYPSPI